MPRQDQLLALFRAFRDRDDSAFLSVARSIVAQQSAANHHAYASELDRSLGGATLSARETRLGHDLLTLPRDRRSGEDLIVLREGSVPRDRIVLVSPLARQIDRVIQEHRRRPLLQAYGLQPKAKLLFWGPPGCGKTYAAMHLGYELGLPVGTIRLSSVISSFLGDTAANLQRVFDQATKVPMVLLLDEVDAVGKQRDDPNDVGELKRIVNTLLQAMDSFSSGRSILIAASNHQHLLDPALWRRFDGVLHFPLPGPSERGDYLGLLLNGVRFAGAKEDLAESLAEVSFADIERVVAEAVKTMILSQRDTLTPSDILAEYSELRRSLAVVTGSSGATCHEE